MLERASTLTLLLAMAWSLTQPWLGARTGETVRRYDGFELPLMRWVLGVLVAAAIVVAVVELVLIRPHRYSLVPAGGFAVLAGLIVVAEEVAASLIPTGLLPASLRRAAVDVYGGVGIWVGLVSAVLFVLFSCTRRGPLGMARAIVRGAALIPPALVAAVVLAGATWAAATWARYQPWAIATLPTEQIEIDGWSLPWVGPLSLIGVFGALAAIVLLAARRWLLGGLCAAGFGWFLSFVATICLVSVEALSRTDVGRWLPAEYRHMAPAIAVGWGAWIVLGLGLCLSAIGAVVIATLDDSKAVG